jgi:hypothetical protein
MGTEADYVIGTIQLTRTTSLVFSVRPWKGRMLAHVRKFVSGEKYEGPTKSGMAMGGEMLMSVIDALTRLKAEAPGVKEKQFAKIHKTGDSDIVVTVIPPDDLKSLPSVDVREYVDSATYTGPTKKGVRFAWEKLTEFIGLLETQARQMGSEEKAQPALFADAHPSWVSGAEKAGADKGRGDSVLQELVPEGPKVFPGDFLHDVKATVNVELPAEPISVVVLAGGKHVVQSGFGFRYEVRNPTEGNFIFYAHLRGLKAISVPTAMIEIFRAVKAYENYARDLRNALLNAYERRSGHRPMAEHQTKEAFKSFGLPWVQ